MANAEKTSGEQVLPTRPTKSLLISRWQALKKQAEASAEKNKRRPTPKKHAEASAGKTSGWPTPKKEAAFKTGN